LERLALHNANFVTKEFFLKRLIIAVVLFIGGPLMHKEG